MMTYLVKKLPYNNSEQFPQRINMKHKGIVYQLLYGRNSYNNSLTLEITRMYDARKIFSGQLVDHGLQHVRDPKTGYLYFALLIKDSRPSSLDVWILDQDAGEI